MKTLDVGEKTIEFALKSSKTKTFASIDKRGHHVPHNAPPDASLDHVRKHIESFPVMDPHYIRKDTHRKFLGSELNITKMYRIYKIECEKQKRRPVGAAKYRKVFCEEYNYSFHTPKKDQCGMCNLYIQQKEENRQMTDDLKKSFDEHIARKERAIQEKSFDKDFAKKNRHTTQ